MEVDYYVITLRDQGEGATNSPDAQLSMQQQMFTKAVHVSRIGPYLFSKDTQPIASSTLDVNAFVVDLSENAKRVLSMYADISGINISNVR